jgi:hypothetical protein
LQSIETMTTARCSGPSESGMHRSTVQRKIIVAEKSVTRRGPHRLTPTEKGYSMMANEMLAELITQLRYEPPHEGNARYVAG